MIFPHLQFVLLPYYYQWSTWWNSILRYLNTYNLFCFQINANDPRDEIQVNTLAAKLFNLNFHPPKVVDRVLCLADAIPNFKWVKIIQIWQNGGQLFSNIADWCHIFSLTCLKGGRPT